MDAFQTRPLVILVGAILCLAVLTPGCAANKSRAPGAVDEVRIKGEDPLKTFEEEYTSIKVKVEEGFLPSETMCRATVIRSGLQKYLIRAEAQLEILRLDVLHGGDDQRERALDQIVELVEKREQTKISYLEELRAVSGTSEDKTGKRWEGKDVDIEITIAPENIDDGERP